MNLSKSRFIAGVQCLKRLCSQVHSPKLAAEQNDSTAAILEQGLEVGTLPISKIILKADGEPGGTLLPETDL
jgi:hypothetical protein